MKIISIASIFSAVSFAVGSAAPPVQTQPVAPLASSQPAVSSAAPVAPQPAQNATAPGQTPEQVLMTCSLPHVFTPEEIKSMNQVFGIAIILLQYQLFVNQDKSGEQETYNQLLKLWRTLVEMFKNVK